jgi:Plasmid replication region DNA-binding N-term
MTEAPPRYGQAARGVSASDVERTADALLRSGERPTIEKVRAKLGTGSPNTINPLLDTWWKRLSARLDAGPAALHRLPESVAHAAEALWMQALDEGRRRAAQEQHATTRALATDKQTFEVRSHVLCLRESELESRLHDREQRQAALEAQLQDLTTLLRKEQATRDAQTKRIAALEADLAARTAPMQKPTRTKSQSRLPHRRKAQRAVASPSGRAAVRVGHGESGARARPIPQRSRPKRAKQGSRPAKAGKRTPGTSATTRRRR